MPSQEDEEEMQRVAAEHQKALEEGASSAESATVTETETEQATSVSEGSDGSALRAMDSMDFREDIAKMTHEEAEEKSRPHIQPLERKKTGVSQVGDADAQAEQMPAGEVEDMQNGPQNNPMMQMFMAPGGGWFVPQAAPPQTSILPPAQQGMFQQQMDTMNNMMYQGDFIQANYFMGPIPGYYFAQGPHGVGYYWDGAQPHSNPGPAKPTVDISQVVMAPVQDVEMGQKFYEQVASRTVYSEQALHQWIDSYNLSLNNREESFSSSHKKKQKKALQSFRKRKLHTKYPFHYAALTGDPELVALAHENGGWNPCARLEIPGADGLTPLDMAALYDETEVMKALLKAGAISPQIPSKSGVTPLYQTLQMGHKQSFKFLNEYIKKKCGVAAGVMGAPSHVTMIHLRPNLKERIWFALPEWEDKYWRMSLSVDNYVVPQELKAFGIEDKEWKDICESLCDQQNFALCCCCPLQCTYWIMLLTCLALMWTGIFFLLLVCNPLGYCMDCQHWFFWNWEIQTNKQLQKYGVQCKLVTVKMDWVEAKYLMFAFTPDEILKMQREPRFARGFDIYNQMNDAPARCCPIDWHRQV